jgi:hypothetical protein
MLSRGDFGAIMHIDIHPPLYVMSITVLPRHLSSLGHFESLE